MVKIDLHIHSNASQYKENDTIVKDSTPQNVDILLDKLQENGVELFSITDHNRFNVDLYQTLDNLMASPDFKYPSVKGLLAGVEFDVLLEEGMRKCHIISIFDAQNSVENYIRIQNAIKKNELVDPDQYYSKEEFESILKDIGINVILIACQRSSLDNASQKHNSLSESTNNPWQLISSGYISALEFQKPNVEGILKNNLKDANLDSGLVMGSDCHEWSAYPRHDSKSQAVKFVHTQARILPTFKGLLMAITSPKTRFNTEDNLNANYIKTATINGQSINLVNGINVIIGENGSGKSTLLSILNNDIKEAYVKKIRNDNQISVDTVNHDLVRFIGQGDIVQKFQNNSLFQDEFFADVDTQEFCNAYSRFSRDLFNYISSNIDIEQSRNALHEYILEYHEDNGENYFITINPSKRKAVSINEHKDRYSEIESIIKSIQRIRKEKYYAQYDSVLSEAENRLTIILIDVSRKKAETEKTLFLKSTIDSAVNSYRTRIVQESTSVDRTSLNNQDKRRVFINAIVDSINKKNHPPKFPCFPEVMSGQSTKISNGFSFNSETAYNNRNVIEDFYNKMFVKTFRNEDAIKGIKTKDTFSQAIRQSSNIDSIKDCYEKNYESFQEEMTKCKRYIVDGTKNSLGNTLGEMSLAYFKYTVINDERVICMIDQPEDHISNLNISKNLIQYFNSVRNKKQLIIVTHNPLLVVNQDADNVIFLSKTNDRIDVKSGALEFENDDYNILDLVAQHMDGGTESIRRRLKVYE